MDSGKLPGHCSNVVTATLLDHGADIKVKSESSSQSVFSDQLRDEKVG